MDIASLGMRIDSSQAREAVTSLDKLAAIGKKVEDSMADVEAASKKPGTATLTLARGSNPAPPLFLFQSGRRSFAQ